MSILHGKQSISLSVFSVLLVTMACIAFAASTYTAAQNTGSLETECVALASASSNIVPASLTPQEFCKVLVAVLGEEWSKAVKLEAAIVLVNDHDVRLAAAEDAIAALQEQSSATLQPQIDVINAKLASVAAALQ